MTTRLYAGATEPVWYGEREVWSVSGFVNSAALRVREISSCWVEGEISDFRYLPGRSMVYFTTKDPKNGHKVNCTIWRNIFDQLGIELSDGDSVQLYGRPDIYEPSGAFQLRVQSIEKAGRGLLMQQLEALCDKLQSEGLFDPERKKPLPFLPRRVGVITGADAAAKGDFLRNVQQRFPPVKIVMAETLVQGDRAAPMLISALKKLDAVPDVDVIVVTRGGGAFEDFLPFSDERFCRAIAACETPVVSAIGHDRDRPVSDLVADLRVSTPTAAAREVVPDYAQLTQLLSRNVAAVRRHGVLGYSRRSEMFSSWSARLKRRSPALIIKDRREFISGCQRRALQGVAGRVAHGRQRQFLFRSVLNRSVERLGIVAQRLASDRRHMTAAFGRLVERESSRHQVSWSTLKAISPAATLGRGYAIVQHVGTPEKGQDVITDARQLSRSEQVKVTFARGAATATIESVETQGGESND